MNKPPGGVRMNLQFFQKEVGQTEDPDNTDRKNKKKSPIRAKKKIHYVLKLSVKVYEKNGIDANRKIK
jgi:hypothetical protein